MISCCFRQVTFNVVSACLLSNSIIRIDTDREKYNDFDFQFYVNYFNA